MEIRISMGGKSYVFTDTLDNAFRGFGGSSKGNKNGRLYKDSGIKNSVIKTVNHSKPVYRKRQNNDKRSLLQRIRTSFSYNVEGNRIDRSARFLFPFCYLLFLAIYFVLLIFSSQLQTQNSTARDV